MAKLWRKWKEELLQTNKAAIGPDVPMTLGESTNSARGRFHRAHQLSGSQGGRGRQQALTSCDLLT